MHASAVMLSLSVCLSHSWLCLSSEFERCMAFHFRVNGGHGTDGWTDRRTADITKKKLHAVYAKL